MLSHDDPKSQIVMSKLYVGKEGTKCDGTILGYSTFLYILAQKPQASDDQTFYEKITIKKESGNLDQDYTMQHIYARKSIAGYFKKDLFFSGLAVFLTTMQYMDFLGRFRKDALPAATSPKYEATVKINMSTWLDEHRFKQYLMSSLYLFQLVQR